jgi:hypothetical protein
MKRRVRASIWKLLLPLPLAVSIIAAAGLAGRRAWYTTATPTNNTRAVQQSPAAQVTPSTVKHPSTTMRRAPAVPPRGSEPMSRPVAPADDSEDSRAALRGPDREIAAASGVAGPTPQQETTSRPAPEPVAPSHEAALRASQPPPAAARAPRLAPAPVVPLLPAPEPQAPPRVSPPISAGPNRQIETAPQVRAVRFDASYYYGRYSSARDLAADVTESWTQQGVNLVYFYAYNRVYGARYRTVYPGNIMEDYGRQDLLRHLLREAHRRDIKVIAWIQGVQHKQMWESHPEWRQKTADGADYKPDADSYFLCVRHPEVMQWWLGLVDELLTSYPDLDGIDLAEFQLDLWGDNACHCGHCQAQYAAARSGESIPSDAWHRFRGEGLSRILLATSRLAHSYDKEVHLTTVLTARRDGRLMSSTKVRDAIGFDLEAILSSPDRPDILQAELIWQQWAAIYKDRSTFTPEWTRTAVRQAKDMVRGRARLIAHIEVTDFGVGGLDGPSLARTIACAAQGGPAGIDIYDAHLLAEVQGVGRHLQMAWLSPAS